MKRTKPAIAHERPIRWLPIDSRLFPKILRFSKVSGVSRLFLEIEITLSLFIVACTLVVAAVKIVSFFVK